MQLTVDREMLTPLVKAIVEQVLAQLEDDRRRVGDRMAYLEHEAARLLGLSAHQLRDERLRGRIKGTKGPGRKSMYTVEDLKAYLLSRRDA